MIKVVAENYIKEGCLEQFLELTKVIVEKTVALDKGCISYSLCQDKANPLHCSMLEEWETQEDLDAHMESEHFKDIIPKSAQFCAGPPTITLYTKLF